MPLPLELVHDDRPGRDSHLHWDHAGDPEPFTSAEIVIGAEGASLLEGAYPENHDSMYRAFPQGRPVKHADFEDTHNNSVVSPFGPFERAIDFYGDGSLYLVDAPGHVAGHIIAAVRVAQDSFIFLSGDACHTHACYAPGVRVVGDRMHANPDVARDTVRRLKKVNDEYPNGVVILAHDVVLLEVMPLFPNDINGWVIETVTERRRSIAEV